jgi:hypothetical protein
MLYEFKSLNGQHFSPVFTSFKIVSIQWILNMANKNHRKPCLSYVQKSMVFSYFHAGNFKFKYPNDKNIQMRIFTLLKTHISNFYIIM